MCNAHHYTLQATTSSQLVLPVSLDGRLLVAPKAHHTNTCTVAVTGRGGTLEMSSRWNSTDLGYIWEKFKARRNLSAVPDDCLPLPLFKQCVTRHA